MPFDPGDEMTDHGLIVGMIKDLKEDVRGVSLKLDTMANTQRRDAIAASELRNRIFNLESWKETVEGSHKKMRTLTATAMLSAVATFVGHFFLKFIAK